MCSVSQCAIDARSCQAFMRVSTVFARQASLNERVVTGDMLEIPSKGGPLSLRTGRPMVYSANGLAAMPAK